MTTAASSPEIFYQDVLVNYLVSMARTVEAAVNKALEALPDRNEPAANQLAGEVFMLEPRINEMEIVIDEHAVRRLREGHMVEDEIRLIVATLKLTNDLERMGDLAVNIAQRVISLRQMPRVESPKELVPMIAAVRAMMNKSLGALIFRNAVLASEVLECDDVVDNYRDRLFELLLADMTENPVQAAPNFQFVLATRYLERLADHATNIAEDVIFWVRGLDVRHRRIRAPLAPDAGRVIENS